MTQLHPPESKGTPPHFPERLTALGIWQVQNGRPDSENWNLDRNNSAGFMNFEPVDIAWQGETLTAYKVARQLSFSSSGLLTLLQDIPFWRLKGGTFDFGVEVYIVTAFRDDVYATEKYLKLFTHGYQSYPNQIKQSVPLKIEAYPEWFKDSQGRNAFIVRTTGVLKGISYDRSNQDKFGFTIGTGGGSHYGRVLSWAAVRPMMT